MSTPGRTALCPCGSGEAFTACCGAYLDGGNAPTAEQLMRSRYTAFAIGDVAYLSRTWHPSTLPTPQELEESISALPVWRRLAIQETEAGGPFADRGTVEFTALGTDADGGRVRLHEVSRFVREDGRWLYVDGDVTG